MVLFVKLTGRDEEGKIPPYILYMSHCDPYLSHLMYKANLIHLLLSLSLSAPLALLLLSCVANQHTALSSAHTCPHQEEYVAYTLFCLSQ